MRMRLTARRGRRTGASVTALLLTSLSLALPSLGLGAEPTPATPAGLTPVTGQLPGVTAVLRSALAVPPSPPLPSLPALPAAPPVTVPPAPSGVPAIPGSGGGAGPPVSVAPVNSALSAAVNGPQRQHAAVTQTPPPSVAAARAAGGVGIARAGRPPAYRRLVSPPTATAPPARTARAPVASSAVRPAPRPAVAVAHPASPPTGQGAAILAGPRPRRAPARPLAAIASAITNPLKLLPVPDWSRPIILALLVLALGAAIRARWNARAARRERRRGEALWRDLQSLQGALVPELAPAVGNLAVSAAYRPADGPGAGGDFYDVFERRDGQVAVVLGDVSGHGRQALTRAAHMRYAVRAYLQAGLSARDALALAGEAMLERGGERFTTVAVGLYDPAAATLSYATAGHAPPLLIGTPLNELVTSCSSPPIGLGLPTGRRETTVSLPGGSVACFFSDGLSEAHTGDGMLGREALASMLADLGSEPQAAELLSTVREVSLSSRDDMAVCIVRARSGSAPEVCCEVIELDAKQLASPKVDQFLQACGASHETSFQAITEAHEVAASRGTAVLHVDRSSDPVQITVAWPHSPLLSVHAGALPALGADDQVWGPGPDEQAQPLPSLPSPAELALVPPA